MSLRSLFAVLPLVIACSAPQPSRPSHGTQTAPSSSLNAAPAIARAEGPATSVPSRSAPAAQERRGLVLELPAHEAFLRAPLPAPRPGRYGSFTQASRIQVGRSHLYAVDLFPGESSLLAASDDEATVRVYERASARLTGNYAVAGFRQFETGGVIAWPEGAPRFVVASGQGLFLYDAKTGSLLETLSREPLTGVRWSPDRRILVAREARAGTGPSRLHFFARAPVGAGTLASLGALDFADRVDGFDLSADNRLLATSRYPSESLIVTDLRTGEEIVHVPAPHYGGPVAFSPDGRLVAVGGQGLLLVDLANPARRAFYSRFGNNVDHVLFSPSGDAVVASSYDGRLRIFQWQTVRRDGLAALQLSLVQTLRHDGQANVYGFVFEQNGDGIVSASGDRTVRTFRAQKSGAAASAGDETPRVFHTLDDWPRLDPETAKPFPPAPAPSLQSGHYHPPSLEGAPRPSSIRPGQYACKITRMYKLRDCRVRKDEKGHTLLSFGPGNLLELEGVLYDDGAVVRFEGWQAPGGNIATCTGCEKQALHAVFRGGPQRYEGVLKFRTYYDPYTPPEPPAADEKIEESDDRYPLVLEFRAPSTN